MRTGEGIGCFRWILGGQDCRRLFDLVWIHISHGQGEYYLSPFNFRENGFLILLACLQAKETKRNILFRELITSILSKLFLIRYVFFLRFTASLVPRFILYLYSLPHVPG